MITSKTSLFLLILLFINSCSKKEEYPVVVEIVESIKVITNPDYPRDGIFKYELEEEISIGLLDGDDNYILNRPFDLKVSKNGTIYIFDRGDINIRAYSKNGQYLRTIGRKGMGPGEFNVPLYFDLSENGHIYLSDSRNKRVAIFDTTGAYISGFNISEGNLDWIQTDNTNIYLSNTSFDNAVMKLSIHKFSVSGEEIIDFGFFKFVQPMFVSRGEYTISSLSRSAPSTVWNISNDGKLFTGDGDKYQISVYNTEGELEIKFGREFEKIPNKYKQNPNAHKDLNDYLAAFSKFPAFDKNGNIWIKIFTEDKIKYFVYDIFSPDGIYLKQVSLKQRIYVMQGENIYSIVHDEDEIPMVKRFRLISSQSE